MSFVSIIIPNYNGGKYIAECIDSCLCQGNSVHEIIIVDDHSTDNSWHIIKEYKQNYPNLIKAFINAGKGACAARNYGYKKSTAEYIQFLDSDDALAPGKIKSQLEVLLAYNNPNKLIHCMWGRFRDSIDDVYFWGPHEIIQKKMSPVDWLIANHMSNTHCWLTHRSLIEKSGLWDESLERNQDGEFFSRLISNAEAVLYCGDAKVYYRSGKSGSISSTKARNAMESLLKSLLLIEQYIFQLEVSERARLSVANRYQDFVFLNYIVYPDLAALAEERVKELGGANIRLQGGVTLRLLSHIFGWKKALQVKKAFTSVRKSVFRV